MATFIIGFYGLREGRSAGYLAAVASNELGGRYIRTIAGLDRLPWSYYIHFMFGRAGAFGVEWLALLAPLGLLWTTKKARLALLYVLCVAFGVVTVFSTGATKHPWYTIPAYPFVAMALAFAVGGLARVLRRNPWVTRYAPRAARWEAHAVLTVALTSLLAARLIYSGLWHHEHMVPPPYETRYKALFEHLRAQGIRTVTVIDGGVDNSEGMPEYTPQLRFYALVWQAKGVTTPVTVRSQMAAQLVRHEEVAASCDERFVDVLATRGQEIGHTPGCAVVRIRDPDVARDR